MNTQTDLVIDKKSLSFFTLSEDQKKIIRPILDSFLINHNSADKKIKADAIRFKLKQNKYLVGDAELRKIIGYIRLNDLMNPYFILSDTGGYWASSDLKEKGIFYDSMKSRALSILANIKPLRNQIKDGNQPELFSSIQ